METKPMPDEEITDAITWERDWDAAFARARRERKPVLIDVEKDH
jgi:hypothetical protein